MQDRPFAVQWRAARAAWATSDPALHAATPPEPVDRPLSDMSSHFAALATSITHQQVSMAAGHSIARRVVETLGGSWDPRAVVALPDEALRAAGLSGAKVRYLRALAEADLRGELAALEDEEDEAVVVRVTSLPGIGVWTAKMFMLFHLRRPDIFSGEDLGLRAGIRILDNLPEMPTIRQAEARAQPWQPYRSFASLVLWDLVRRSRLTAQSR